MTAPQLPGSRVRERRSGWQVSAERVHDLQQLAVCSVGSAALVELELTLAAWFPPQAGWVGNPGIAGITEQELIPKGTGVRVRLACATPVDAGVLLAAALRMLRPFPTGDVGPLLTFCPGLPAQAASVAGRLRDVRVAGESRDPHVRRCDVVLVPTAESDPDVARTSTVVVRPDGWLVDGTWHEVCVDPTVHRPFGRRSTGGVVASGTAVGERLTIDTAEGPVVIDGDVTMRAARALRSVLAVIIEDPVVERTARQLAACGVLVTGSAADLPRDGDDVAWQARSVQERRAALRRYGPTAALDSWPTVSVVMSTNRPDHLEHAVRQLASLRYPRLEVVIGSHGPGIDPERVRELSRQVPHPVTVMPVDGGRTLGEALQACTERSSGSLVTKMDDDDHYGPEHVWDLVLAREYSGAQLVGKALDWIYLESEDATVFRPTYAAERYADFVCGGTMLISRADLLALGGWRPIPKAVDRALQDAVLADGGLVYRTHGLGYIYVRHSAGHTASVKDEHFLKRIVTRHPGLIRHEAFGTDQPGAGQEDR